MKLNRKNSRFTLIELLIVIAIIAILAAIMFGATMVGLNVAKKSKARSEIGALQRALKDYSDAYRGFDKLKISTGVINPNKNETDYKAILSALSQRAYAGNDGVLRAATQKYNPKKITFWETAPEDFSTSDYKGFKDPWGNYYVIWFDAYGEGWAGPGGNSTRGEKAFHLPACVFSPGPNGFFELDVDGGSNVPKFRKASDIETDDVLLIK